MRITGLALVPPPSAADLPKVTPELLASVLARYSRSNEGIGAILSKVDLANPDASIDRILKFVDYGHASIGGPFAIACSSIRFRTSGSRAGDSWSSSAMPRV